MQRQYTSIDTTNFKNSTLNIKVPGVTIYKISQLTDIISFSVSYFWGFFKFIY